MSIVIPAYNEEESICELYGLVKVEIEKCINKGIIRAYEILWVDDGSADNTREEIIKLSNSDENVKYIFFRRNFGKSVALQTAFHNLTGDIVITMDADIQDEPSELGNFIVKLAEGNDLVVGWKVNRLDPAEKRLPSK